MPSVCKVHIRQNPAGDASQIRTPRPSGRGFCFDRLHPLERDRAGLEALVLQHIHAPAPTCLKVGPVKGQGQQRWEADAEEKHKPYRAKPIEGHKHGYTEDYGSNETTETACREHG